MFSFLLLVNNSGTVGGGFLLLTIPVYRIIPYTVPYRIPYHRIRFFVVFVLFLFINILMNIAHIIWVFGKSFWSLHWFKSMPSYLWINNWYFSPCRSSLYECLSVPGWWLIRLSNTFVFPIHSLQSLMFCKDDQEFIFNLDCVLLCFLL